MVKMSHDRVKKGRYSIDCDVSAGRELQKEGPTAGGKIVVAHGVVIEPSDVVVGIAVQHGQNANTRVSINISSDVLEREFSHDRISALAYAAGNEYTRILHSCGYCGPVSPSFEPPVGTFDHQEFVAKRIELANRSSKIRHEVRRVLGKPQAIVLQDVLIDGWSLLELAQLKYRLKTKTKQTEFCAAFRKSLEDLGEHWQVTGWPNMMEF